MAYNLIIRNNNERHVLIRALVGDLAEYMKHDDPQSVTMRDDLFSVLFRVVRGEPDHDLDWDYGDQPF